MMGKHNSWKPIRGNRILLDKHIERNQRLYFSFYDENDKMKRSKIAYSWYVSSKYLNDLGRYFTCISDFAKSCIKDSNGVYKPFLKLANENFNATN